MTAVGPQRRFAAVRQDACNGTLSRLSADAVSTAGPDPVLTSRLSRRSRKLAEWGGHPRIEVSAGRLWQARCGNLVRGEWAPRGTLESAMSGGLIAHAQRQSSAADRTRRWVRDIGLAAAVASAYFLAAQLSLGLLL